MTVTQSPDEVLRHQKEKETVCPGLGWGWREVRDGGQATTGLRGPTEGFVFFI